MNPIEKALTARGVKLPPSPVSFNALLRDAGVAKSYVIAMTGRCGSTWLATSLSQIPTAGEPMEYFSEEGLKHYGTVPATGDFKEFIVSIIKAYKTGSTFGFKIDGLRLSWIERLLDFNTGSSDHFPSWVDMRRRNIVKQAMSFARAKKSGLWHLTEGVRPGIPSEDVEVTDESIWREIEAIMRSEIVLDLQHSGSGQNPLRLVYEDLLDSRDQVIFRVLHHVLGRIVPFEKIEDRTRKLQSKGMDPREIRFCAENIERLASVYRQRTSTAIVRS